MDRRNQIGALTATDATATKNLFITGPSPWADWKAFGALGDTLAVNLGSSTCSIASTTGTITCPAGTFNCTPSCLMSPDNNKYLATPNPPFPAVALPAIMASTGGGGALDGSIVPYVYLKITVGTSGKVGAPSLEAFVQLNATSTANKITVTAPTLPVGSMATQYNVYAAGSGGQIAISLSESGTTVTATTSVAHPFVPNEFVIISGVGSPYAGTFQVLAVPSSTMFTYTAVAGGGSASGTASSLISAASGLEQLQSLGGAGCATQSGSGCALTGNWVGTTLTTTSTHFPPPPAVFIAQITSVATTASATVSPPPTPTFTTSSFVYGHDDSTAIQAAINACIAAVGCRSFGPPGSYWVNTPLTISASSAQNFVFLQGAGAANSTGVGLLSGNPTAATEIVTPQNKYALIVGQTGSTLNAGPRISGIGFRDVSGACNAPGGVEFLRVAHAYLDSDSFADFCGGNAIYFNGANQYNVILNATVSNAKSAIVFANGLNSSNWIVGGNLAHSQVGGGACIDFQPFSGATSGGHNYIQYPQCNFFPVAFHAFDQNSAAVFMHAENTAPVAGVMGASGSGVGVVLDGTFGTGNCFAHQIGPSSFSDLAAGVEITPSCSNTSIVSPSYPNTAVPLADSGVNTQTTGAPPAAQTLAFLGPGNSMAEYFPVASGFASTAGRLQCFNGTATVADCAATAPRNVVGVALTTANSGNVAVQLAGITTVTLDGTVATVAVGDIICASGTIGKAVDNGGNYCQGTLGVGAPIGIAAQTASGSPTSVLVFLRLN